MQKEEPPLNIPVKIKEESRQRIAAMTVRIRGRFLMKMNRRTGTTMQEMCVFWDSQVVVKNPPANAGDARGVDFIPWSEDPME